MLRSALIALLGLASFARADAQFTQISIPTCAHADSLLGEIGDDAKGTVRRRYKEAADSTFFVTGPAAGVNYGGPSVWFNTGIGFPIPRLRPEGQLMVSLRGGDAATLTKAAEEPRVFLLINDDPPRQLTFARRGQFFGLSGPRAQTVLPVSAVLTPDEMLALARAERSTIRIEKVDVRLSRDDRRDLRALYRAAACEHPD